ncbi:MAG: 30S ribosomal protein S19e [Halobacteria archaeon]|nr:30S ribosomal protein S19e [Halobacteria archaeon]
MTTAHDVPAEELIESLTEDLKERESVEPPEWAEFAKTGQAKELPPEQDDWWYRRTASLLRRVYIDGPVGVSRLKKRYGGKERSGMNPAHQREGSGSVIRTALQQLEDEGFVETIEGEGRTVTSEGQGYVDDIAEKIAADIPELEKYQ